ncbi:MAG: MBL fold metallo-hydrolase [Endomicrobium sp.]|nr:MBL fold metallo-hydrolase [Endomicrobium sp.]
MKKIFCCLTLTFVFACVSFADGSGVRKYALGTIEFIAVKDMDTNLGKSILLKPDAPVVKSVMFDGQNPSSINVFVVKTKDKNILIDTGNGAGGDMFANLSSIGISPDDFGIIVITHMHGDHVNGLVSAGGVRNFKNAKVYIAKLEFNYWLNTVNVKNLAKQIKAVYGDDLKMFEYGENITPEIKALSAIGHTPGHTIFEVSSGSEKILVVGDIVHNIKVQTADPSMSVAFDSDPQKAAQTRRKIFRDAAKDKIKIAGMHIPFPGIGYLTENAGDKYTYDPTYK